MRSLVMAAVWTIGLGLIFGLAGCEPKDPDTTAYTGYDGTTPLSAAPPAPPPSAPPAADPASPPAAANLEAGQRISDLRTRKDGIDWPTFLGPDRNSKSPETGINTAWPPTGPKIRWTYDIPVGYGMCSTSLGRLFIFGREQRSNTTVLLALNAETGEKLWEFTYPTHYEDLLGYNNGPRCQPIVDEDRVYILGAEGMLHCLEVEKGKVLWKIDTNAKFGVVQNFFGVGSTPIIEGDLLITHIGGSPPDSPEHVYAAEGKVEGNGTCVVAFDKRTGAVRYKLSDDLASYSSPLCATIGDRRFCFLFARRGLLAFDPQSGKQDFHYPWRAEILESVNAATPVVVGDQVFISETYGPGSSLLKVTPGEGDDPAAYQVVWRDDEKARKKMQTHWNTPVHHEGHIYASSGRHTQNAELRCMKLDSGEVTWRVPGLTRSSCLYIDNHLICLTEYGKLLLIKANPEKYDEVVDSTPQRFNPTAQPDDDRALLRYPCWAAPIVSHGLLYCRGDDKLVCFELIPDPRNQ